MQHLNHRINSGVFLLYIYIYLRGFFQSIENVKMVSNLESMSVCFLSLLFTLLLHEFDCCSLKICHRCLQKEYSFTVLVTLVPDHSLPLEISTQIESNRGNSASKIYFFFTYKKYQYNICTRSRILISELRFHHSFIASSLCNQLPMSFIHPSLQV